MRTSRVYFCQAGLWRHGFSDSQNNYFIHLSYWFISTISLMHAGKVFVSFFFCNTHPASRLLAVYWVQSSGWRCCWVSGHQGGMWGCSIWTRVSWTFHSRRQRSKVISLTKDLIAVLVIYILAGFTSSDQQQFAFFKHHTFILFSTYCTYNECIFYECLKIENHPEKWWKRRSEGYNYPDDSPNLSIWIWMKVCCWRRQ